VRGGSPGERSETRGVGFVKEVGFKPGLSLYYSAHMPRRQTSDEPEFFRQFSGH